MSTVKRFGHPTIGQTNPYDSEKVRPEEVDPSRHQQFLEDRGRSNWIVRTWRQFMGSPMLVYFAVAFLVIGGGVLFHLGYESSGFLANAEYWVGVVMCAAGFLILATFSKLHRTEPVRTILYAFQAIAFFFAVVATIVLFVGTFVHPYYWWAFGGGSIVCGYVVYWLLERLVHPHK